MTKNRPPGWYQGKPAFPAPSTTPKTSSPSPGGLKPAPSVPGSGLPEKDPAASGGVRPNPPVGSFRKPGGIVGPSV
jgi:hypothetical protein